MKEKLTDKFIDDIVTYVAPTAGVATKKKVVLTADKMLLVK